MTIVIRNCRLASARVPEVLPPGYYADIPPAEVCRECGGEGLDQNGQFRMNDGCRVWNICEPCNGSGRRQGR